MLDKLRRLRADHLLIQHGLTFYPYQEEISDQILIALLDNLRITAGATEEDVKKLKQVEIAIELSRQCIAEGSFVSLSNGDVKAIEDIILGDEVVCYEGLMQRKSFVKNVWETGEKECFEIRTRKGKKLVVSKDHKLLTPDGFLSIADGLTIQKEARINCHKSGSRGMVAVSNSAEYGHISDPNLAKILGYFADGYTNSRQTPKFTNTNVQYIDEFEQLVKDRFGVSTNRRVKGNGFDLHITNGSHVKGSNQFINWLRQVGLYNKTKPEREMPSVVFNFDRESLGIFLNRFIASDGWVSNGDHSEIGFSGVSEKHAKQIVGLLSKVGITSYCGISNGIKSTKDYWKIRVADRASLKNLVELTGPIFGKEQEYWRVYGYIDSAKRAVGRFEQDIYWDHIQEIKPVGIRQTYDLEVDQYHNYVANELVVHNSGKTYAIGHTGEFILTFLPKLFNRPIRIGIFAAQIDQAKISYGIMRNALRKSKATLYNITAEEEQFIKEEENAKKLVMPDGSSAAIAPINLVSQIEGLTLDLIIIDEAQVAKDKIVKHSIWPMGKVTNSPRVYIGKAGTSINHFYRLSQRNETFKAYFDTVATQRRETYRKTGDPIHLIYEQSVREDIEKQGIDADEIQREYFGKWQIGTGQFVTQEDLMALEDQDRSVTHHFKKGECFAGIDTGKHPDSTVCSIIRDCGETVERTLPDGTKDYGRKKELLNWMELRGENYQNQFDILRDFLSRYNIVALAIDSTGQGDFMPDMFENNTEWQDENSGLYRIKFSATSKDIMYKNLKVSIQQKLLRLPSLNTKIAERFKEQMLDLQQEHKGQLLSVHHPDSPGAKDDFADSLALADFCHAKYYADHEPQLFIVSTAKERKVVKDDEEETDFYWPGLQD